MSRILPFDGVHNFRDFGDYPAGAKRVRRGALYRSAHHARATDSDLEALAQLNLAVIVDLRRPGERLRDPSRRWNDFAATVIENDVDDLPPDAEDPYHSFLRESDLSPAAIRAWNLKYYREAPFKERHVDLFARYFRELGRANGPVLIHCAIGRDRTGLLAALTLHLLGVSRDDILADYLLTNDPDRLHLRTPDLFAFIEKLSGRPPTPETIHALATIEPALLETALNTIAARHGALDRYFTQVLGIDARLRAAIEENLLA
jgi:protein tyrosine/serine phosphatase